MSSHPTILKIGRVKLKLRKYLLVILFASCSFVLSSCDVNTEAKITEENVLNMLIKMEQAAISHDIPSLTENISENAIITMDMPSNMGGKQTFTLGSYKEMLKQGWEMPAKSTYEIKDIQISVASDGMSATATDITVETVEMDGKVISAEIAERIEIISENGKPVITSIYGKVKM